MTTHDHAGHDHDHGDAGHSHDEGGLATHGGMDCCGHEEISSERQIIFYLVGSVLLVISHIMVWFRWEKPISDLPALVAALMLGVPLFRASFNELRKWRASSATLAAIAILAAIATANYQTAGWLAFILLFFDQFVRRTASGAQRAIEALVGLTPDTARIVEAGAEREVQLSAVAVGMTVRVRPGENLPVDGRVATGRSTINQASLTGEAVPVEVQAGDPVYAGTTNLTGGIDVTVTQVGGETTIGKVTKLIREAESSRTPRQLLIQQVAGFFVPIALSVAAVTWFMKSQNPETSGEATNAAIGVLIVTCPAALLIASPSAMVAAFAAAARLGILIKQTAYLEDSAHIDAVVLDKTGTITTGKFEVAKLAPAPGVEGAELLKAAAKAEQPRQHRLGQSIPERAGGSCAWGGRAG